MICIDTNILIWGVKGESSTGQEHRIPAARKVLTHLSDSANPIAIPAPVVTEYLCRFGDEGERLRALGILSADFVTLPFDAKAARETARLLDDSPAKPGQYPGGRRCLKFDAMILGTALAFNCTEVLTENAREFRGLAGGRIVIKEIADIELPPHQPELDNFQ